MESVETLELFELQYSDLMLLSSEGFATSTEDIERLESITKSVMENLGPAGPGLLAITGVPNASALRQTLLPLARELALLSADDRMRVLKDHNLGSDVPLKNHDRLVSSFAMQLKYGNGLCSTDNDSSRKGDDNHNKEQQCPDVESSKAEFHNGKFSSLGDSFKELGLCMIELGLSLARICDRAIGGQELEKSLMESCSAKGRLIHYHSTLDGLLLKEAAKIEGLTKRKNSKLRHPKLPTTNAQTHKNEVEAGSGGNDSILWQQWHYDYGIFTVLTVPMFILPRHSKTTRVNGRSEQECPSPSGHTYLKIFDPSKSSFLMVKASPESFIVQVGESADLLSKGKLRAILHSVCRPENAKDLSRETFVVFLQPAWNKTFSLLDYPIKHFSTTNQFSSEAEEVVNKLAQELNRIVPPLSSRMKDGMTFADFARETTKQYYGGSGLQSNK